MNSFVVDTVSSRRRHWTSYLVVDNIWEQELYHAWRRDDKTHGVLLRLRSNGPRFRKLFRRPRIGPDYFNADAGYFTSRETYRAVRIYERTFFLTERVYLNYCLVRLLRRTNQKKDIIDDILYVVFSFLDCLGDGTGHLLLSDLI